MNNCILLLLEITLLIHCVLITS